MCSKSVFACQPQKSLHSGSLRIVLFCMSTVLTHACFWPPRHCNRSQNFEPFLTTWITIVHHYCWIPTSLCAVATPLHILYEMDRQQQPSRRKCHVWSRTFRLFLISGHLRCLCLLNKVFIMHLIGLQLLPIKVETKISSESRCITSDQKPNSVNAVLEWQRTAAAFTSDGRRNNRIHGLFKLSQVL